MFLFFDEAECGRAGLCGEAAGIVARGVFAERQAAFVLSGGLLRGGLVDGLSRESEYLDFYRRRLGQRVAQGGAPAAPDRICAVRADVAVVGAIPVEVEMSFSVPVRP